MPVNRCSNFRANKCDQERTREELRTSRHTIAMQHTWNVTGEAI